MVKTIAKIGNSHGIVFDSALMELAHLKPGDEVNIEVHAGGTLTLTPLRPRPSQQEVSQVIKKTMKDRSYHEEAGMSATADDCFHLTTGIVLEIHAEAISQFGGSAGIRNMALLESAVAAPQATVAGKSPFADLAEIGAAYLFYLCRNHPFVGGNKRTALGACIVFLRLNGLEPTADGPHWEKLTFAIAASAVDRSEAAIVLRKLLPKAT